MNRIVIVILFLLFALLFATGSLYAQEKRKLINVQKWYDALPDNPNLSGYAAYKRVFVCASHTDQYGTTNFAWDNIPDGYIDYAGMRLYPMAGSYADYPAYNITNVGIMHYGVPAGYHNHEVFFNMCTGFARLYIDHPSKPVRFYVNLPVEKKSHPGSTVSGGVRYDFTMCYIRFEVKSVAITSDQKFDKTCECEACCPCECTCGKFLTPACDGECGVGGVGGDGHCWCHCNTCTCDACCECRCTCGLWTGTHCRVMCSHVCKSYFAGCKIHHNEPDRSDTCCDCHCECEPDCEHCCACTCDCAGGWTGPPCTGQCGAGGCTCHCPECEHCCACTCDCAGGWQGKLCTGQCGAGGCGCHCSECTHCCACRCDCAGGWQGKPCSGQCGAGGFGHCMCHCEPDCDHCCACTCDCDGGWKGPECNGECLPGGYTCHCGKPECEHCCACRCDCEGGWAGDPCNGKCGDGGCDCHCLEDWEWFWDQLEEFEVPKFAVPDDILEDFAGFHGRMMEALCVERINNLVRFKAGGQMGVFCIENPIRNFNGFELPDMKACLDFDELAQSEWVSLFRTVLLYMAVMTFIYQLRGALRRA